MAVLRIDGHTRRDPRFPGVRIHPPSRGTALYESYCWTCHGKTGKGDGPIAVTYKPRPRDLTDRAYLATRTDRDLYNVISRGGGAVERSPTCLLYTSDAADEL